MSSLTKPYHYTYQACLIREIHMNSEDKKLLQQESHWFFWLGIGLIVLGSLAILFSVISGLISVVLLGILLIGAGIFEGVKASRVRHWNNFFLHLFLAIIYIIGGALIVSSPLVNELFLTLLLAFFFIVSGIARIIFSIFKHVPHRGWLLFNGVITLLLGLLIAYQWPVSGLWVIGTFVGVDALITGWTWIMLSYTVKKIT